MEISVIELNSADKTEDLRTKTEKLSRFSVFLQKLIAVTTRFQNREYSNFCEIQWLLLSLKENATSILRESSQTIE